MVRLVLTFIILCLFPLTGQAEGLAMHGQPKYGPEVKHLGYANPKAPKGGTITYSALGTFDSLNPYAIKGKAAEGLNLVYDRLMGRVWDEPFTMYPLIAERAVMNEDRSAITFDINPKARFHDGTPITADDVIFSFETLREHGRPNMRAIYKLIDTVEKRGERTVHFEFGEGFDQETGMIVAMMPVLSKAWWKDRTFDSGVLETPNLNGPYRIIDIDPGRRIVYERVKDYWAQDLLQNVGHNNFDRVVYDYYRDDTVAFEAFKAGDFDIRREIDAGRWASAYDFPTLQAGKVKKEALPHGRPERVNALIFNTRRAPFDDIRVRKALDLLFDFQWVNKNLFHSQYRRIQSFFPGSELAATDMPGAKELKILQPWKNDLKPAVFGNAYEAPSYNTPSERRSNMKEASSLLNKAGWVVQNGQRMKDGKPFEFELLLSTKEDEKLALHFKKSLEQIGIKPQIRVLDAAAYRGRLNEYDFDMTLYYWLSSLSPGTEQILYWGCEAAKQPARWNFPGICDPAIDAIAQNIASTKNREDLVAHVRAMDRILMHGHYIIPLYYSGRDYIAYWKPIKRPQNTPLYGPVLETWWMDQPSP